MQLLTPPQRRPTPVVPSAALPSSRAPLQAWGALGVIGAAFFALGMLDIAFGWFPAAFGNMEWEFGTISGSLNALAIPMLGLYLTLASAIARSDRRVARTVCVIMAMLLVTLVGLGVVYLTVVPVAIKSVSGNALVALGMKKAVAKAATLGIVDCVLLVVGIRKGWRVPSGTGA